MKRLLSIVLAAMLVIAVCLVPAGAVPAMSELPYGIIYGNVNPELLGLETVVSYDSFSLVRGHAQLQDIEDMGGSYQPLPDRTAIYLRSGTIDSSKPLPAVPGDLNRATDNLYLVQLIGPVKAEWVDQLSMLGEVLDYIPNFSYVMNIDGKLTAQVLKLGFVRWVGPYLPAYRIDPEVLSGNAEEVVIKFYGVIDKAELINKGLNVVRTMNDAVTVRGSAAALRAAARMPGVAFIEPVGTAEFYNDATRNIIRSYHPHNRTVTGIDQIGAVTDTGIHWEHEAFNQNGKLLAYIDYAGDAWAPGVGGDGYGHGTHCAGSMAGNAPPYNSYNSYDGQGFSAQLIAVKVGTNFGGWSLSTDFYTMWQAPYCLGARVNTNSWGFWSGVGGYPEVSHVADQICWDYRNYVLTVAAGNSGGSGPGYLGAPGTAKNVITVGATERQNPENVAYFSSRGPTSDDRIKPDVMAPGVSIISAQSGTVNGYIAMSGTSMAAPQVAGAALLVRDYFMRGFYPTGIARVEHEFEPSAALVKAVLINGAQEMTGTRSDWNNEGVWPNNAQGWGRINLQRSLYFRWDTRRLRVWDNPADLTTGQRWTTIYNVPPCTRDVKFTLVWTDHPAAINANVTLRNDLHLRVTSPTNVVYLGNNFQGLNPGYSVPGGYPDARNTVEGVHLVRGPNTIPSGQWQVEVFAANIPDGPQNFALVISLVRDWCIAVDDVIAVHRDWDKALASLAVTRGFQVWEYETDYRDIMADMDHMSVMIINMAENNRDFDILLEEAAIRNMGVVLLSQSPAHDYGLGVLSDRTGDPAMVIDETNSTGVYVLIEQDHPITVGLPAGTSVQLFDANMAAYQVYQGYSGETLVSHIQPVGGVIGVTDMASTQEGRHVIMAGFGVCPAGHTGHWTVEAEDMFINAIKWAREHR